MLKRAWFETTRLWLSCGLLAMTVTAHAADFNLAGGSGTTATASFSSGGIGLNVTGPSLGGALDVRYNSNGLGIDKGLFDLSGIGNGESMTLTFSQFVNLNSLKLAEWDIPDDAKITWGCGKSQTLKGDGIVSTDTETLSGAAGYKFKLEGTSLLTTFRLNGLNATVASPTGFDHLRLSTASITAAPNTDIPITIKACANPDCSATYKDGVTGTLAQTDLTVTWSPSANFTIPACSDTAIVKAKFSNSGKTTLSLSTYAPTPSNTTKKVFCGIGVTPAADNSCDLYITPPLHHVRVSSVSSGLTCTPNTYTITACADASCSTKYTGGLTGTLSINGTGGTVNYPDGAGFTIPSGSSEVALKAQLTKALTYTVGLTGLSQTPTSTPQVYCGMGTTPASGGSCTQTMADAGFLFDVPHHVSGVVIKSVTVSAVHKSDKSLSCTPAFADISKTVNFKCAYSNPSTGSVAPVVGGSSLTCGGSGSDVSLSFNANGVASTTVSYADAGQVTLNASYTGSATGKDEGLSMTGTDSFVAVPAQFKFSDITAGPIKAGATFAATVTALNSSGGTTPNFGKETTPASATLSFTKRQPTGTNSAAGIFSGSLGAFSSGAATANDLNWSEVGNGDLTATTSDYLGTGLSISGTTGSGPAGSVGPFIPNHFDVTVIQACPSGDFTYSDEPFKEMTVTARNVSGGVTQNYDGTANTDPKFAKAVTLSAVPSSGLGTLDTLGTLGTTSLAASAFSKGVSTLSTQKFIFTDKLTAPAAVKLRAVDADNVSSSGQIEGEAKVRSGRLKMFNAFGSEKAALDVPLQIHYWTGKAWVINSADNCTQINTGSVVRARYLDNKGAATTNWSSSPAGPVTMVAGQAKLSMAPPTVSTGAPAGSGTGTVELAINLGNTNTDQSCLSQHPSSTGLNKPWLRSVNGSCAATHDRDPSARATFGVYAPETQKAVHVRDVY